MNVKGLIEELQKLDPELPVVSRNGYGDYSEGEEVYVTLMPKGTYNTSFPNKDICLISG